MRRHLTLISLIVIAAALAAAGPAAAGVTVEGTGEPAYTNSTQNTQWFSWQVPDFADSYRLRYRYYRDNVLVHETSVTTTTSGTGWANWSGVATLVEGSQYGICVQGEYSFPNDSLYFPDGPNSCSMGTMEGKRSYTTIDRTKPTASVVAAGGAAYAKQGSVPVSIDFQDATAGPHPANFICVQAGSDPCESGYQYSSQCSVPAGGGRNTTFSCNVDASQLPDGPVSVCVIASDAALPDNPSSANQTGQPHQANRSDAQCDTVLLDRQGPTLTVNASKTVALTGETVAFSSQASDSVSGIDSASARWEFGDGSATVQGGSASHAFSAPGTYVVTFRVKDAAGHESTAQRIITVEAPPVDTTPPPGDGTTPPPGDGTGTPPTGQTPTTPIPGAGSPASVQIGSVTVLVPKRVRLGRAKHISLGSRTDQGGVLKLTLVRGKNVLSRLTARLAPGESSHKLRLPRRLKAGTYAVKITFKAAGAGWSAAGTAKVAFR